MPYALLSLLWVSIAALFATAAAGLGFWGQDGSIRLHVIFALSGTTLALFAHTMTMFYFIGTGKKIKDFVSEWDQESRQAFRNRIIETKRKLFPHMTFICLVIMAAFIIGGAVDAGLLKDMWHKVFAYIALIYHVHVVSLESIHIIKNVSLIADVNRQSYERDLQKKVAAQ